MSVEPSADLYVPFGTGFGNISMLPPSVTAVLNDSAASNIALPVVWDNPNTGYNAFITGTYHITGSLKLPDDGSITNNNGLKACANIHVLPQYSADWSSLQNILNQAEKLSKSNFTSASWNTLIAAVDSAKALPATATQQQVDSAAQNITQAIQTLIRSSTDSGSGGSSSGSHSGSSRSTTSQPETVIPETAITSDTTTDVQVKGSYTMKLTSKNGQMPAVTIGTSGVFKIQLVLTNGSDYYVKLIPIGKPGQQAGVYVNGIKLFVATVQVPVSPVKCDTTAPFTVKAGSTYTIKLTADSKPILICGTAGVFRIEFKKSIGNDYYYRVIPVGKADASSGFYVNSEKTPITTARIV